MLSIEIKVFLAFTGTLVP